VPKEGNFYVYEKRKDGCLLESFRDLIKSLFVGQCIRGYFEILMKRKFVHVSLIKRNILVVRWNYYVFPCVRICSGVLLEG
jgi:hypothetical protein